MNSSDVNYLELGDELKNFDNDNTQSKLQQLGNCNITGRKPTDKNRNERYKREKNRHGQVSKKPRFLSE